MLEWRIFAIVSFLLWIGIIIFLKVKKFCKNIYLQKFNEDDISKENYKSETLTGKNTVFFTPQNVRPYIKKYVISRSFNYTLMISNYSKPFKHITYYILQYNKRKNIIGSLKVTELNTNTTSKIVGLHSKCQYVNLVIQEVDGISINSQIIKPMSNHVIRFHSALVSLSLFFFLIFFRQVLLETVIRIYAKSYLDLSIYNVATIGVFIVICFLNFLISVKSLKLRNNKNRDGGILEYEFF